MKVHETGDYGFLLLYKFDVSDRQKKELEKVWQKIYKEYIKRFGYTDHFLEVMMKKREIALLKVKMITSSDKTVNAFIRIAEEELKELSGDSGIDFYQGKSMLEKTLGFHIDIHKVSVAEYYSHYQVLKRINTKPTKEIN